VNIRLPLTDQLASFSLPKMTSHLVMWHLFLPYTWTIAENTGWIHRLRCWSSVHDVGGKGLDGRKDVLELAVYGPRFYIAMHIWIYEDMLYSRVTVWYNLVLTLPNKAARAVMLLTWLCRCVVRISVWVSCSSILSPNPGAVTSITRRSLPSASFPID
jgi:hypothetical protein